MVYPYSTELWEAMMTRLEEDDEFGEAPPTEFYIKDPNEVVLMNSGGPSLDWKIVRSYGMTSNTQVTGNSVDRVFYLIDETMKRNAVKQNCNGVVGYERELYLWEKPIRCVGCGVYAVITSRKSK